MPPRINPGSFQMHRRRVPIIALDNAVISAASAIEEGRVVVVADNFTGAWLPSGEVLSLSFVLRELLEVLKRRCALALQYACAFGDVMLQSVVFTHLHVHVCRIYEAFYWDGGRFACHHDDESALYFAGTLRRVFHSHGTCTVYHIPLARTTRGFLSPPIFLITFFQPPNLSVVCVCPDGSTYSGRDILSTKITNDNYGDKIPCSRRATSCITTRPDDPILY